MKRIILIVAATVLLLPAVAAPQKAQPGFEKLKTLVGQWEGTNSKGKPSRVSYRMASNGSVLEEVLEEISEGHDMITMYHADGNRLLMTHYCGANNQPRMQGQIAAGGKLTFTFLDATNLASPSAGHMRALVLHIVDKDHFTQEWSWHENGRVMKELFRFARKK